ncbi:hypothetical protein HMPREF0620_0079 [Parascardovia denticolens DSM 10105 = JCM 12538]|uniref:Uncharacterized protein n=1 Tax=Parascardovia denticolens DSM 10105 = JCM 12538 TaxID=864564 RepID=E6JYR3_PARDN|nr:hypothetical protein HMPREF0620_0079 [Parascardovia denticolens DSM 10105 = JCM 12538]
MTAVCHRASLSLVIASGRAGGLLYFSYLFTGIHHRSDVYQL